MIARGGYTFSQVTLMSPEEKSFIHYHQGLVEQSQMKTLLKALGVIWDKEDFNRSPTESESSESYSPEVYIPLAMTINPSIHKFIGDTARKTSTSTTSRTYGDGTSMEGSLGKVRSMAELSKEDFYRMISHPIPSKMKKQDQSNKSQ